MVDQMDQPVQNDGDDLVREGGVGESAAGIGGRCHRGNTSGQRNCASLTRTGNQFRERIPGLAVLLRSACQY